MSVKHTPSQATETPISLFFNLRSDFTKMFMPLALLDMPVINPLLNKVSEKIY